MAEKTQRRLAAIVAADVAGYSRLMRLDEEATMAAWWSYRKEVIDPMVAEHGGRVVKLTGDGFLAEFASATDAVSAAIAMQSEISSRVSDVEEEKRVQFRMGVNLGDILWDDEDIYGDGVNIAARIEALAEPGGVLVSASIYDLVHHRVSASFKDMGDQDLKNIDVPVRVYRVGERVDKPEPKVNAEIETAPDLALPDKPSVAVMPFDNMSGDPEQEYFADGITEDIITALSKISSLLVIARNSTFTYKGKLVDVKQVSREQGVRYVLEGSVRKIGNRVRVTAQLIDATTGGHAWAERYDRDIEDIFAVQDEIAREVVVALDIHLSTGEQARIWSSGTKNLEAWESVRLGMDLLSRGTPEALLEAQSLCKRARDLDPDYVMPITILGWLHHNGVDVGYGGKISSEDREVELDTAMNYAKKALELDPLSSDAYSLLGTCHLSRNEYDQAIAMSEQAITLAPNHAENLAVCAITQNKSGRPERALELIKKAMRLCPICPSWYPWVQGMAYRLTGQMDSAISAFKVSIEHRGIAFKLLQQL